MLDGLVRDSSMARRLERLEFHDSAIAKGDLIALARSLPHLTGLRYLSLDKSIDDPSHEVRHDFKLAWRRVNLERWKAAGCKPAQSWCKVCDETYSFAGSDLTFRCSRSDDCVAEGLQELGPVEFGGIHLLGWSM